MISFPGRGAKYCDKNVCCSVCVCLSVCLSARSYNWKTTLPNLTKFLCMLLVALARSSCGSVAMSCTSGFVDGVMFSHCPYGES